MTDFWVCPNCRTGFADEMTLKTHWCKGINHASVGQLCVEVPSNPKDQVGSTKLPLGLFPAVAIAHGALALFDGKCKYGENNYRATPVRASIYLDAALRHLHKLYEGEDTDPESGVSHAGHILASIAIYLDAEAAKTLIDDRKFHGSHVPTTLAQLTSVVPSLQAKHADKSPHHYTIQDSP